MVELAAADAEIRALLESGETAAAVAMARTAPATSSQLALFGQELAEGCELIVPSSGRGGSSRLLSHRPPALLLRIPVRAAEAWLLADRESLAAFLSVSLGAVPEDPESLDQPKRHLVELARRSRRRAIREDMVPPRGSSASVGRGAALRPHVSTGTNTMFRPSHGPGRIHP